MTETEVINFLAYMVGFGIITGLIYSLFFFYWEL